METDRLYPWSSELAQDTSMKFKWTEPTEDVRNDRSRLEPAAYPTTRTLAYCAWLAYKDDAVKSLDITKELQGWQVLVEATSSSGYHGLGLWHPIHKQLVISHRGTKLTSPGSLWADLKGVIFNQIPGQLISAVTFTHRVLEKMKNSAENVFMVGHSLGGWLAAVSTYSAQYLTLVEEYFVYNRQDGGCVRPHSATFDAPGSKEILTKLQDACELRLSESDSLRELDITNYVSGPSKINSQNHHVGVLIRVFNTSSHTTSEHSIRSFLRVFGDDGDIAEQISKAVDWPVFLVVGKELTQFQKFTNLETGKPKDTQKYPKGYNPTRYWTESYSESQCSLVALRPEARELIQLYDKMRNSIQDFKPELPELKSMETLLTLCKISDQVLSCPTSGQLRELIPKLNRVAFQNIGLTFNLLSQKNLKTMESSIQLQFNSRNMNADFRTNANVDIVCEDRPEIALQRLLQTKPLNEKRVLVFTQEDLINLINSDATKKGISKTPEKFLVVLGCTNSMSVDSYKTCIEELQSLKVNVCTLTNTTSTVANHLQKSKTKPYILRKTQWRDLADETKHHLLHRKLIVFQEDDERVSWSDILLSELNAGLESIIDEDTLEKLINNQVVRLLKAPKLPPKVYVKRKLQIEELKRESLNEILKTHACYIKGIPSQEFTHKYMTGINRKSKIHFVDDFTDIQTNDKKVLVQYKSSRDAFYIVSIQGERDTIKYFLQESSIPEDSLVSEYGGVTLICGEPGVGKSTVLKSISTNIKKNNPHTWVLHMNLNDHTDAFLKHKNNKNKSNAFETAEDLFEFLTTDLLNLNRLEKKALMYVLQQPQGNIVILLDSVDEVSPTYKELVLSFVFAIKTFTHIRHLVLSSRNHLKDELEMKFLESSMSLTTYDAEERLTFIKQRMRHVKNFDEVEKILNNVEKKSKLTNSPLILEMIADVSKGRNKFTELRSVSELYYEFIERKIEVYKSKLPDSKGNVHAESNLKMVIEKALIYHERLARKLVCCDQEEEEEEFSDEETDNMLKLGIIERRGPVLRFVHHTFAEYLVAKWVFILLHKKQNSQDPMTYLMTQLMVDGQYQTIRTFLNDMMKYKQIHAPRVEYVQKHNFHRFWKSDIPLFYITAVQENNVDIIKYFWERFGQKVMGKYSIRKRPGKIMAIIHEAAKYHNYNMINFFEKNLPVKALWVKSQGYASKNIEDGETYIDVFIRYPRIKNDMRMTDYMVKTIQEVCTGHNSEKMYSMTPDDEGNTLAHKAAIHENYFVLLQMHKRIMNKSYLLKRNKRGETVLHVAMKSLQFVPNTFRSMLEWLHLLDDVNVWSVQDNDGNTPLHYAESQAYFKVLLCTFQIMHDPRYLILKNKLGETVLHKAFCFSTYQINESAFMQWAVLIKQVDTWFIQDNEGNTPLHFAAFFGYFKVLSCVHTSMQSCDYLTLKNQSGETIVHLAMTALRYNETDFCDWYEMIYEDNVWSLQDNRDQSLLHFAARNGYYKILFYLVHKIQNNEKWKAQNTENTQIKNTNAENKDLKNTPELLGGLKDTLTCEDYTKNTTSISQIFQMLDDANVWSVQDELGNTLLHYAASEKHFKVLIYLHNRIHKRYLQLKNIEGQTVLHKALESKSVMESECLRWVEHLTMTDVWMQVDVHGNTPAHLAAKRGYFRVLMFVHNILNNEEYLCLKNNSDKTPVHMAMQTFYHKERDVYLMEWTLMWNDRSVWQKTDQKGNTPMHYASFNRHFKCLDAMHNRFGYNKSLRIQNMDGQTPLHIAIWRFSHHLDVIGWLETIDDAEVWVIQDLWGNTPVHWAAYFKLFDILTIVHRKINSTDYLKVVNKNGETPLDLVNVDRYSTNIVKQQTWMNCISASSTFM